MAIENGYTTVAELKAALSLTNSAHDADLEVAIEAASRAIDDHCGRRFWLDNGTSARVFYPTSRTQADVDDFDPATAPTVKTDDDDDGTFEVTWPASDFVLEPLNPNADIKLPQNRIRTTHGLRFYPEGRHPNLQVTAKWGWPQVPTKVKQACRLLAHDLYKAREAAFGIAGMTEMGVSRIRDNPMISKLIDRFQRVMVG